MIADASSERRRERLLDEDVHARARQLAGHLEMLLGGHRDDRELRAAALEQLADGREDRVTVRNGAVSVASRVHGARELDPRRGLQQPRVMAADHAQAEDGAAQRSGDCGGGGHGRLGYRPMDQTPPGLVVAPTATVGRDVTFGAHVVVHPGVVIGDGCVIQDARGARQAARAVADVVRAPRRPRAARHRGGRDDLHPGDRLRRQPDRRPARSSATRPTCASAPASAPTPWSAARRRSTTTS